MINPSQREQLRQAVLVYLVERHPLAFDAFSIERMIRRQRFIDFPFETSDLSSAIAMLLDSNLIKGPDNPNRLGASRPYTASAEGLLYAETEGLL